MRHYLRWNPELDAKFTGIYTSLGKRAAMDQMGLSEAQVRSRASTLKLKARGVSKASIDASKAHAEKLRGRKRPEHAALMSRYVAEKRVLVATDESKEKARLKQIEHIKTHGHPRGALGMKHSEETKRSIGKKSKQVWEARSPEETAQMVEKMMRTKEATGTMYQPRMNASWEAGWREVGGRRIFFRSRWEANYGRYLEWLKQRGDIKEWEHEPVTFWFEKIKRGSRSYLPDFRVTENNGEQHFHEVKGWMDARSKTKLNRMRIYHPSVIMILIREKQYKEIAKKISSLIPGWE
jgi:hypothetical protein